jgi:hypothetical protein
MEKSLVPDAGPQVSELARRLFEAGCRALFVQDGAGRLHWSGDLRNADDVRAVLAELRAGGFVELAEQDGQRVLDLYEATFHHRSFTGRSGTFFGYEGLGCIYWHMVSKLLLAVQETFFAAEAAGARESILERLAEHYRRVRHGLGFNKTPAGYGAFPTDPYSHTPAHGAAQQPGMTGQVKEDVLARWGELGVLVEGGCVRFRPALLDGGEFLARPETFTWHDEGGEERSLQLDAGTLAFTLCGVPVVYRLGAGRGVTVVGEGRERSSDSLSLDREDSAAIFGRTGRVERVEVRLGSA